MMAQTLIPLEFSGLHAWVRLPPDQAARAMLMTGLHQLDFLLSSVSVRLQFRASMPVT